MSPNTGNIYNPEQVEELKERAPDLFKELEILSPTEAVELGKMPHGLRKARLRQLRTQVK